MNIYVGFMVFCFRCCARYYHFDPASVIRAIFHLMVTITLLSDILNVNIYTCRVSVGIKQDTRF